MFVVSELLKKHGVKGLFSDRAGGVSPKPFESLNLGLDIGDSEVYVKQNLDILCEKSGVTMPHQARQVHGSVVLHCFGRGKLHEQNADILIASERGVSVAVRTADCVPLLLADFQSGVVCAAHAGWKGTVQNVAGVAVQSMVKLGSNVKDIVASVGPCIHECCFEISDDVAEKIQGASSFKVIREESGKFFADLPQANVSQLLDAGVHQSHIENSCGCSSCNVSPDYFSYRRDHGLTGRQLSIVMLP